MKRPILWAALLARNGITTLADLKGKRVGYGSIGALDHLIFLAVMKKIGLGPIYDQAK
jgi:TRAP-type uncharacterized transport system substrate-binding protein